MTRRLGVEEFSELCGEAIEEVRKTANEYASSSERNSRVHYKFNEGSPPSLVQTSLYDSIIGANTDNLAHLAEHLDFNMIIDTTNNVSPCRETITPYAMSYDFRNKETTFNSTRTSSFHRVNSSSRQNWCGVVAVGSTYRKSAIEVHRRPRLVILFVSVRSEIASHLLTSSRFSSFWWIRFCLKDIGQSRRTIFIVTEGNELS